jgi:hypothetical protein
MAFWFHTPALLWLMPSLALKMLTPLLQMPVWPSGVAVPGLDVGVRVILNTKFWLVVVLGLLG